MQGSADEARSRDSSFRRSVWFCASCGRADEILEKACAASDTPSMAVTCRVGRGEDGHAADALKHGDSLRRSLREGLDEHAEVGVAREDRGEVAGDGEHARDDVELEVHVRRVARYDGRILAHGEAAVGEALDLDDLAGVARQLDIGLVVEERADEGNVRGRGDLRRVEGAVLTASAKTLRSDVTGEDVVTKDSRERRRRERAGAGSGKR